MTAATDVRRYDIATADLDARIALRDQLRAIRVDAGVERKPVAARLGFSARALYAIETRTNWRIATVQQWSRALGYRFHVDLDGLAPSDEDGNVYAALYRSMKPAAPEDQDELAREVLVNSLTRIRKWNGLTAQVMADRLGISPTGVLLWEQGAPGLSLAPCQRVARALGGRLDFRLELINQSALERTAA